MSKSKKSRSIIGALFLSFFLISPLMGQEVSPHCLKQDGQLIQPNYQHPDIIQAVLKLNQVQSKSFNIYSEMKTFYRKKCLGENCQKPQVIVQDKEIEVSSKAHQFLTILCGEYIDHKPMLKKKIQWVKNMNIVSPNKLQTYDPSKGVWEQMTGHGYLRLLHLSELLYKIRIYLKKRGVKGYRGLPTPALTGCEYRYLLKLISRGFEFKNIGNYWYNYRPGYEVFKKSCSQEDLDYYFEFRGDGNFKPQTLEANSMIWFSRSFFKNCTKDLKPKKNSSLTEKQCKEYFEKPFQTRMKLSKETALKMFLYPKILNPLLKDYNKQWIFVTEDINGDGVGEFIYPQKNKIGGDLVIKLREKIKSLTKPKPQWARIRRYKKYLSYVLTLKTLLSMKEDLDFIPESSLKTILKSSETLKKEIEKTKKRANKTNSKYTEEEKADISKVLGLNLFSQIEILKEDKKKLLGEASPLWTPEKEEGLQKLLKSQRSMLEGIIFHVAHTHEIEFGSPLESSLKLESIFPTREEFRDRLTTVLDRHTDWYKTDMIHLSSGTFWPTYSPWVASSYYIHKSHPFTIPGYSMGLTGATHRQWMFIQKVHKKDWFNMQTLNSAWPKENFDLFNYWFDESQFSRSKLGASEAGWDRFASPETPEVHSILYLYNIPLKK